MAQTTTLSTATSGPQIPPDRATQHNMILAALFSKNSGSSAPAPTTAFMWWLDTSADPAVVKIRNAANDAWVSIATLSAANAWVPAIANDAVVEAMIASGAVTAAKIGAGAVTSTKLGAGAVATDKLAAGAVTGAKMEASGVTAGTYTAPSLTIDAKGRVTSASSGSSSALALVETRSITAVGTIDFDLQEDVYCEWVFALDGVVPAEDGRKILMRPGHTGGTSFESGNVTTHDAFDPSIGAASWCVIGSVAGGVEDDGIGTAAGEHGHAAVTIGGLGATLAGGFVSESKCAYINNAGNAKSAILRSRHTGGTARLWDAVRFMPSSGSFEATGTIKMFALKRAG